MLSGHFLRVACFSGGQLRAEFEESIGQLTLLPPNERVWQWICAAPNPEEAASQFRRWIAACANPSTAYSMVSETPATGECFFKLLGSSRFLADVLVQNSELASLILSPELLTEIPVREAIESEGRRLFATSSSPSHRQDQLRYLKQSWMLRLTACDLCELKPFSQTLADLSTVADALVSLASGAVWADFCHERDLHVPCPITIIAFGKLGGFELNYSSDLDLVYALEDDADEQLEKEANRFAARLNRAMSDHMGRGALYRVDNRLRPFGSSGPLVAKFRSIETYYQNYAASWEVMAMVRSRVICGSGQDAERWNELRSRMCFSKPRGQWFVDEVLHMRGQIEGHSHDGDLKRGSGGIRDIEFAVQLHQVILGHIHPALQHRPTLECIGKLIQIDQALAETWKFMAESYTFMRRTEHALQLVDDRQTHALPTTDEEWHRLSKLMKAESGQVLRENLHKLRILVRENYDHLLHRFADPAAENAADAMGNLSDSARLLIDSWIDGLPNSEHFRRALHENPHSLERFGLLAQRAPGWCQHLRHDLITTESILSGEIEERSDWHSSANATAQRIKNKIGTQFAIGTLDEMGGELCDAIDAMLIDLLHAAHDSITLIALGSYAGREMTLNSDLDCMLLTAERDPDSEVFSSAQAVISAARARGIRLDMRLRPDGGRGEVVRSYDAILKYELESLESWERMAWSRSRLVHGKPKALNLIRAAAYNLKFNDQILHELVAMKKRIETERVSPATAWREVKLGIGGLLDIDWTLQLLIWRHTDLGAVDLSPNTNARIQFLVNHGVLRLFDAEALTDSWRHLRRVRDWLSILRFSTSNHPHAGQPDEPDVVPENPDKLDHLAKLLGFASSNDFLQRDLSLRKKVRGIYEDTLNRLSN